MVSSAASLQRATWHRSSPSEQTASAAKARAAVAYASLAWVHDFCRLYPAQRLPMQARQEDARLRFRAASQEPMDGAETVRSHRRAPQATQLDCATQAPRTLQKARRLRRLWDLD